MTKQQRNSKIVESYAIRGNIREVAEDFGMSFFGIRHILLKNGVDLSLARKKNQQRFVDLVDNLNKSPDFREKASQRMIAMNKNKSKK